MKFVIVSLFIYFCHNEFLLTGVISININNNYNNNNNNNNNNDRTTLQDDWSYCYEFTWLGPGYDNFTTYNGTCNDYLDETRAMNIPCSPPIVISYNGTYPDIDYLWNNHRASVLCKLNSNQYCIKYTYKYNEKVYNATYMCSKVLSLGEGDVVPGCYTQDYEGYQVEICICRSNPGIHKPCNSSINNVSSCLIFILSILILFLIQYM